MFQLCAVSPDENQVPAKRILKLQWFWIEELPVFGLFILFSRLPGTVVLIGHLLEPACKHELQVTRLEIPSQRMADWKQEIVMTNAMDGEDSTEQGRIQ